MYFNNRDF